MPLIQWVMQNLSIPGPTPVPEHPSICFQFRAGDTVWVNCYRGVIVESFAQSTQPFYIVKIGREVLKFPECAISRECVRAIPKLVIPSDVTAPVAGNKIISSTEEVTAKRIPKLVIPSDVTTPIGGKKIIFSTEDATAKRIPKLVIPSVVGTPVAGKKFILVTTEATVKRIPKLVIPSDVTAPVAGKITLSADEEATKNIPKLVIPSVTTPVAGNQIVTLTQDSGVDWATEIAEIQRKLNKLEQDE